MADPKPEALPLSLEEVLALRDASANSKPFCVRLHDGEAVTLETIARLCAAVEHYAAQCVRRVEESDRVIVANAGYRAENARLSALVARMRVGLMEAQRASLANDEYDGRTTPSVLSILLTEVLVDPDGQHATEELRLLRAWEAAVVLHEAKSRKCPGLNCSQELIAARLAKGAAWEALRAFREKNYHDRETSFWS